MGPGSNILSFGDDLTTAVPSHLSQLQYRSKRQRKDANSTTDEEIKVVNARCIQAISLVLNNEELPECYETYYRGVEALCRHKRSTQPILADRLTKELTDHFVKNIKPEVEQLVDDNDQPSTFIKLLLQIYNQWKRQLDTLSILFLYLDRAYLLNHSSRKTIVETGRELFVENLLAESSAFRALILDKYISLLDQNRQTRNYNDTTAEFTSILFQLNENDRIVLQGKLVSLIATQLTIIREHSLREPQIYIEHALSCLTNEMTLFKLARAPKTFLHELLLRMKWVLLFQDFKTIISSTISHLLQPSSKTQLLVLFLFCVSAEAEYGLDAVKMFVFCWGAHIYSSVVELIKSVPKSENWISPLVQLYDRFESIYKDQLSGRDDFEFELRSSITKAVNEPQTNSLVLGHLSKYCDAYLRDLSKKSKKTLPATTFSDFLKNVLLIFKFINDKNSFMVLYKKDLSKRLLMSRSSNIDTERSVVAAFLDVVGDIDLGREIDTMLNDYTYSKLEYNLTAGEVEFSALVLSKLNWPEIPGSVPEVIVPQQLRPVLDDFCTKYYGSNEKFKGRVLDWSHFSLHQLEITAYFKGGNKELTMNLLQAIVVLLFSTQDSFTFEQLLEATKMDDKLLKRVLVSLSEKYSILKVSGATYTYNIDFKDKNSKLKIPFIRERENTTMDQNAARTIKRNRDQEIRAAIVKSMKSAKTATVPELFDSVISLVAPRGSISLDELNANLEFLISSQYVLRQATQIVYIP